MSFFKMAWQNMRRNFADYLAYFVSTVFAVMVFYVFTSIFYNEQFRQMSQVSEKLNVAFQVSAIIVAIFSAVFLWYSSNFFLRRRKKEIGMYSLLGMEKRQIGRMLFYENLFLGMLALLCGIGIGMLLSKFFLMMLLNLMQIAFAVRFSLVPLAVVRTVQVFLVLFVIISLHGYSIVYRFKLIDLFQAPQEGERAPKASIAGAALAVLLIGAGYYLAFRNFSLIEDLLKWSVLTILVTVAGTYVLFGSLIIMLLKWVKSRTDFYYRGTNMISTSQILYRIKGNARTLATIAVLSAVTITAVAAAYSYYRSKAMVLEDNIFFTIQHISHPDIDPVVEQIIARHQEVRVMSRDDISFVNARLDIADARNNLASYVIGVSQYNAILQHQKRGKQVTLAEDECRIYETMAPETGLEGLVGSMVHAQVDGVESDLRLAGIEKTPILNAGYSRRTLVVPDAVYEEFSRSTKNVSAFRGYMLDSPQSSGAVTDELFRVVPEEYGLSAYYDMFQWLFQSAGIIVFIGAFLGVLFLLATGSIIYFKQLNEAYENRVRYSIMRNIGVSRGEVKQSVARQLLLVFGLPLVVGVTHSSVALATLQSMLHGFKIYGYVLGTMVVYLLFYGGYYFFTVNSYLRVVERGR